MKSSKMEIEKENFEGSFSDFARWKVNADESIADQEFRNNCAEVDCPNRRCSRPTRYGKRILYARGGVCARKVSPYTKM